ncbi:hypothetical protein UFOVP536_34 [uncultured Caudovirales phage]|uniref:Uncharacterized protein n=1 Tax=uncultured Caudovirales phage TaxID=2100421 RepID=A0A6J5MVI5_9CAUD|nr:hypothetical protein UFOVP536_34 [uncultured Caudovirales phage]
MAKNNYVENAKFEDVILDMSALDLHYQKYVLGSRYKLALHCYQYVEQNATANKAWALRIQAGVHGIDLQQKNG